MAAGVLVMALVVGLVVTLVVTPRPRAPIWFGISYPGTVDPARAAALTGVRPSVGNVFVKLDSPSFGLVMLRRLADDGLVPMLTLEPWSFRSRWGDADASDYRLARITDGTHDAALSRVAAVVRSFGAPVLIRFAHEMNGWWYPWAEGVNDNSSGDYVRAWRHVHALFAALGAHNAQWVWAPTAIGAGPRQTPLDVLYPGTDYVDYLGLTAYGHDASASSSLAPTYRALCALGPQPVLLTEVGADGPAQAAWIADLGRFVLDHPRVRGFVLMSTTRADDNASGDYAFDKRPDSVAALRNVLGGLAGRRLLAASPLRKQSPSPKHE